MECEKVVDLLDGYIDLELDAAQAAEVEEHVGACARCAALIRERERLRSVLGAGMTFRPAPREAVHAIEASVASSRVKAEGTGAPRWAWASLAACMMLAGALTWSVVSPLRRADTRGEIVREAVSSHIRSLMGDHLADVAVSDQHVVKPWFAGKLEFSPRVVDFASSGYPLAGGRLDYVAGLPAAAIVYKRHAHVINLLICSDPGIGAGAPRETTDRGYQAISWTEPGMRFCAVSDLNAGELMEFVGLVRSAGSSGE